MAKMDVNMWKSGSSGSAGGGGYENGLPAENKANTNTSGDDGGNVSSSASSADSQVGGSTSSAAATGPTGPDPAKLKAILDRTNYSHQVTVGQRKYGGPPPDWTDPAPASGCEIFVGHIPKDVYEDELIPLFEKIGTIWDLRLMIDPLTSHSRGYGFITYTNAKDAQRAVQELNGHKIRSKNFALKVNISVPNVRLFIGNIPKIMSKEQIFNEFNKITEGLTEVITYSSPDDRKKNRGFCFLEFDTHKNASAAKRKLTSNGMKIFKCDILVDWADPQEEPDEETMAKVKVLYVRNLTSDVTESQLKELFEEHGTIERVKKIKDYAFVHFEDREQALTAMEKLNGRDFVGSNIEISLAKPPSDRRKKEEILRNRERRMYTMMQQKQYNMMAFPHRVPPSTIRGAPMPVAGLPPPPSILPIRNGGGGGGGGRNSSSNNSNHGHHQGGGGGGGHHRFSHHQPPHHHSHHGHHGGHLNPMMGGPIAFNRQGQPWNPLLHFYDPSEPWWYAGGGGGGGGGGAGHHSGRQGGSGGNSGGGGGHHHHHHAGAAHAYPASPFGMPPPGSTPWNAYLPNGGQVPLPYGGGGPAGGDLRGGGGDRRGHHQHGGRSGGGGGGLNGSQSNPNHRKWRKSSSSNQQQQQSQSQTTTGGGGGGGASTSTSQPSSSSPTTANTTTASSQHSPANGSSSSNKK